MTTTPSKIDKIEIQNFKFFPKMDKAIDVQGKHILMYGENGSGKSSIYWALYTLLEASNKENVEEIKKYFEPTNLERLLNINYDQTLTDTPESYVKIIFQDKSDPFIVSLKDTSINENFEAKTSNYSSDFINYRHLLNLYNFAHSEEVDIFHFFSYAVLPYVQFTPVKYWHKNLNGTIEDFETESASEIYGFVRRGPKKNKLNKQRKPRYPIRKEAEYGEFNNIVNGFYNNLEQLITYINTEGNPILKDDLGYDITFKLILDRDRILKNAKRWKNQDGGLITEVLFKNEDRAILKADFHRDSFALTEQFYEAPNFHIWLKIEEYEGKKNVVNKAHSFLNEAKLTAVALAIRLAVLKRTLNNDAKLKILVFDDLMISLDMSNREKVMNLILNKYIKEYQVFILTHDRVMFEDTKRHIEIHTTEEIQRNGLSDIDLIEKKTISQKSKNEVENTWMFYEMYQAENKDNMKFPFITQYQTEIKKALYYFRENIDYDACGTNLRKALECFYLEFIPPEYNKSGKMLQGLNDDAKVYFNSINFSKDYLYKIDRYLKRSLNPTAHYNPQSNYYKKELEDIFDIYFEFQKLYNSPLIAVNSCIKFEVLTTEGFTYSYKVKLLDPIRVYKSFDDKDFKLIIKETRNYAIMECNVNGGLNTLTDSVCINNLSLKDLYEATLKGVIKKYKHNPIAESDILKMFKNESNVSLDKLLDILNS